MDGDPFLPVGKIAKEHHAMIDPMTELELDYGPDIRNKILAVDPNAIKHDEES
ncbi:MAG: hypothetical protein QG629_828 [Patescibacteria group bacterium]|nr:hypothetical protein [Patescibacteria group bacterium]